MELVTKQKVEALFSPALTGKTTYTADEILLTLQTMPTVEAIPISWINDYLWHIMATNKIKSVEERAFRMMGIKDMLFVWEHWGKENESETDRC